MRKIKLFTIGYEGRDVFEFVRYLKALNVSRIIDVRELPLSRKKGFSKSHLRNLLEMNDIEYIHMKELGSPSIIRHQLKRDNNYQKFFLKYSKHLENNPESIERLYKYLFDKISCLMCFERSAKYCHRSIIAEKIKGHNGKKIDIIHI